jgi:hypothetical protein
MPRAITERTMDSRREPAPTRTIAQEVAVMVSHPDWIIDYATIRHQELQAECAQYRRSVQVGSSRNTAAPLRAVTQATRAAVSRRRRSRLRVTKIEKLFDVFARINHLEPL